MPALTAAQIAAAPSLRYAMAELAKSPIGRAKLDPKVAQVLVNAGLVVAESVETFRGCSWQLCQLTPAGRTLAV